MIHEIEPKTFCNQYKHLVPDADDFVLAFRDAEVLIARDESPQGEGRLSIPKRIMFPSSPDNKFRYLFEISGERYFLLLESPPHALEGFAFENVRLLRQAASKDVCFAAMTAFHLHAWYRDNRFCGRCGTPLRHGEAERVLICPRCGNEQYPRISPAVIVGLYDGDRLLLTKYAGRTYKQYALIAGYTEIGETPEQTVAREVMEEVGLKVRNVTYYKSQPWGVDGSLLLGYFAELDGGDEVCLDEDELASATWFERDRIPVENDHISLTREMIEAFRTSRFPVA